MANRLICKFRQRRSSAARLCRTRWNASLGGGISLFLFTYRAQGRFHHDDLHPHPEQRRPSRS